MTHLDHLVHDLVPASLFPHDHVLPSGRDLVPHSQVEEDEDGLEEEDNEDVGEEGLFQGH